MEEYPRLINNLFTVEEGGITDPPAMYQKRNAVMCPVLFKGKKHYKGRKRKNTSVFFLQTKKVCHYRKFVVIAISFHPFKTAIMADIKPLSLFMSSDSRPEKDITS